MKMDLGTEMENSGLDYKPFINWPTSLHWTQDWHGSLQWDSICGQVLHFHSWISSWWICFDSRWLLFNSIIPWWFRSKSNGFKFTTKDKDQDSAHFNCAAKYGGGWWYNLCFSFKPTGQHYEGDHVYAKGIHWQSITGFSHSFKKTSLKVRRNPIQC